VFERFTGEARQVVVRAQDEARRLRVPTIEPVHLLLAIAAGDGRGSAVLGAAGIHPAELRDAIARSTDPLDGDALAALGVDLGQVRAAAEAAFGPGALERGRPEPAGHLPFADASKRALEESLRHLVSRRPKRTPVSIDSGHLLFGVLAVDDPLVGRVLQQLGTDAPTLQERADGSDAA
jgi:ATP-dependent Clp protease ATP-binding subunit ClpA